MRLDVTICYSILEACFENFPKAFDNHSLGYQLIEEIKSRKIILHRDLEEHYAEYFTENRPDLVDLYQAFVSNILLSQDTSVIIDTYTKGDDTITKLITNDYLKLLYYISKSSYDKIIFSNLLDFCRKQLIDVGVSVFNQSELIDRTTDTILNNYRIPIIRKRVIPGQSNADLSAWLSRFLMDEQNLLIIDNYIYKNSDSFLTYFLNSVSKTANIKIYTILDRIREIDVINKFTSPPFSDWNIQIHIIPNKREQHARNIFTDNYYIEIDKGMAVFGSGGLTSQADITVQYRDKIKDHTLPISRKIV